jgi:hypothetical protein
VPEDGPNNEQRTQRGRATALCAAEDGKLI